MWGWIRGLIGLIQLVYLVANWWKDRQLVSQAKEEAVAEIEKKQIETVEKAKVVQEETKVVHQKVEDDSAFDDEFFRDKK